MRNGRLSEQKHGLREAGLSVSAAMDSQSEFYFYEGCFLLLKYFKTLFFNLLIGHEYFNKEYVLSRRRKKENPLIFQIKVDFAELLHQEQTHQPTMMVRNGRRLHLSQRQHQQQWLTSSLLVSSSITPCLTNKAQSFSPVFGASSP